MDSELKSILAKVFDVEESSIGEDFGPGVVKGWDSAGHMRLIMALEEAFDVMFDDDEVGDLIGIASISQAITRLKN